MGEYFSVGQSALHILMIAAENGALAGGKVGGLGDVVRDLPRALARAGQEVSVLTPGYGKFSVGAEWIANIDVAFAGATETLGLFKRPADSHQDKHLHCWILEHPLFAASGIGKIYSNDEGAPFATDANKFALFNIGVCELLKRKMLGTIDILNCHDWHTTLALVLREFDPRYQPLKAIPTVFSIHNLALQGVRPLRGQDSSLEHWLPNLNCDLDRVCHPFNRSCINFMRAGVTLADRVQTVSPSYAEEILRPSDPGSGFVGGEGLERDLQMIADQGRLAGILNGCEYPSTNTPAPTRNALFKLIDSCLHAWAENNHAAASFYYALRRVQSWSRKRKLQSPLLVSIGRMSDQKLGLLCERHGSQSAMDAILDELQDGIYIMLGSGEHYYEDFFSQVMARHDNFLYLQGFSEPLSDSLYASGDLFVMPSCFEPCGISQMLALRAGMPCLVHATGGLKDTVIHMENGFSFGGKSREEKAANLVSCASQALATYRDDPPVWKKLSARAQEARFSWDRSAQTFIREVYEPLSSADKDAFARVP